jgi:hypothetical protein
LKRHFLSKCDLRVFCDQLVSYPLLKLVRIIHHSRGASLALHYEPGPELNPCGDPNEWLNKDGAPQKKLANEKPKGETVDYDQLIEAWRHSRVK